MISEKLNLKRIGNKEFLLHSFFLLAVGIILSVISLEYVSFSMPSRVFLEVAQSILKDPKAIQPFMQLGYTAFIILCLKSAGLTGLFIGQALAYIVTVMFGYLALRLARVSGKIALLAALVISLHPQLIFNIKRVVDNNLSVPLLVLFVTSIVCAKRYRINYGAAILMGGLFGYMILVRPNFASLMPIVLFVIISQNGVFLRKKILALLLILITALSVVFLITVPIAGRLFIFPSAHGAYNFFGGANVFTEESLLSYGHVEASIGKALSQHNLSLVSDPVTYAPNIDASVFWRLGINYIKEHPFRYLYLGLLKLFILVSPDYRMVYTSGTGFPPVILAAVKTVVALPIFIWVFLRLRLRRYIHMWDGLMVLPVLIFYLLPFALTGAESRYRLPLDIILILDIGYCLNVLGGLRQVNMQKTVYRPTRSVS